ncbi:hypothetical protein KM043_018217 [Ampulex compressa]|nr:hypothetical protein KM043_018217 [Ampulex compressa]
MAATTESVNNLKKRCAVFKSQLTRFENAIDSYRQDNNMTILKRKFERLTELFRKYDEIQLELNMLDDVDDHIAEREDIEEQYVVLRATAQELIDNVNRTRKINSETKSRTRLSPQNGDIEDRDIQLPKINLPTFNGAYEEWPGFADQFKATVHNNERLTDGTRLTYLRSCLTGEAAKTIASLGSAASNNAGALSILEKRCDQPRVIVDQHLRALFEIPKMHKPSYHELSQFLNTTEAHTEALDALGQSSRDTLLIYLLASRLDSETELKWRETPQSRSFPQLNQFLEFLHDRRRLLIPCSLDSQRVNANVLSRSEYKNQHAQQPKIVNRAKPIHLELRRKPQYTFAVTTNPCCAICKDAHYTSRCKKLEDATTPERREMIKTLKLCLNCLRVNHIVRDCTASHCERCNGKHHTILHEDARPTTNETNVSGLSANLHSAGLLSTAIVDVLDHKGNPHSCRVLLNTGSQSHFISKDMATKLCLEQRRIDIPVSDIRGTDRIIKFSTNVAVRSRRTDFLLNINCLVLNSLDQTLPSRHINRQNLKIPKNIKLADPDFHKPRPIDAILGVQVFHKLLSIGKISIANDALALIKTKLGWIIMGDPDNNQNTHTISCNLSVHELDKNLVKF